MGSTLEELSLSGGAHVNLVVSSTGLGAAKALQELFGTPYVIGTPIGHQSAARIQEALAQAARTGENRFPLSDLPGSDILIIGEAVTSLSLACAWEQATGKGAAVLCPTEFDTSLLRSKDLSLQTEDEIQKAMAQAKMVIADPMYQPICPPDVSFVKLPTEAFSGRLFRKDIPNLISEFEVFFKEVL
jgi:hypothetical protein